MFLTNDFVGKFDKSSEEVEIEPEINNKASKILSFLQSSPS